MFAAAAHTAPVSALLVALLAGPVWHDLALGDGFVCLRTAEGRVACPGLLAAPPAEPLTGLVAGDRHACGLRGDGTLACWGEITHPPPAGTFTAVAVGSDGAWGLRADGTLAGWAFGEGAAEPPVRLPSGRYRQVAVGHRLACALDEAGALSCAGVTYPSRLDEARVFASPGFYSVFSPRGGRPKADAEWGAPFLDPGPFTAVSISGETACALRAEGLLRCFGPLQPPPGVFRALSGECAVDAAGEITCFGWGEPARRVRSGPVRAFSARRTGWAALDTEGRLVYQAPLPLTLAGPVIDVAPPGPRHEGCTLHAGGGLLCGNRLRYGPFVALDRGGENCGVTADGQVDCLDYPPRHEELPTGVRRLDTQTRFYGTLEGHIRPFPGHGPYLPVNETWRTLPSGPGGCGVLRSGRIHCTSLNKSHCRDPEVPLDGQPAWQREKPACVRWPADTDFVAADSGIGFGCALKASGAVVCFGEPKDSYGKPVGLPPPPPGAFVELAVGGTTACGRRADGTVYCADAAGSGTAEGRYTAVRAGEGRVCGVRVDGAVACWGQP